MSDPDWMIVERVRVPWIGFGSGQVSPQPAPRSRRVSEDRGAAGDRDFAGSSRRKSRGGRPVRTLHRRSAIFR
jgi:hypothetical protein